MLAKSPHKFPRLNVRVRYFSITVKKPHKFLRSRNPTNSFSQDTPQIWQNFAAHKWLLDSFAPHTLDGLHPTISFCQDTPQIQPFLQPTSSYGQNTPQILSNLAAHKWLLHSFAPHISWTAPHKLAPHKRLTLQHFNYA